MSETTGWVFPGTVNTYDTITQGSNCSPFTTTHYSCFNIDEDWVNPNNVKADDTSYSTNSSVAWESYIMVGTNYGFSSMIGENDRIDGIETRIYAYDSTSFFKGSLNNQAVVDGTTVLGYKSDTRTLTGSFAAYTRGSSTDDWGVDTSDVRSTNFGQAFQISGSSFSPMVYVDYIQIRIWYTTGISKHNTVRIFP